MNTQADRAAADIVQRVAIGDGGYLVEPPRGWRAPTPNSVTFHLVRLSGALDELTALCEVRAMEFVQTKSAFDKAYARAFLSSTETSEGKRKADATLQTADLKFAADAAEQVLRSARERLGALREQIELGRSLGAAARAEWVVSGQGTP